MKRLLPAFLISALLSFCFSFYSFAQVYNNDPGSKAVHDYDEQIQYLLTKSKKQKKTGWILFGSGMAVNLIGSSIYSNSQGNNAGVSIVSGISSASVFSGIAFFFAAARTKEKAQQLYYEKNVKTATSEEMRQRYLQEANSYFMAKAKGNTTAAVLLTSLGAAFTISGIIILKNAEHSEGFLEIFNNSFTGSLLFVTGISMAVASIPFYVKASRQRRVARMILETGQIPHPSITTAPQININHQYVSLGIHIPF